MALYKSVYYYYYYCYYLAHEHKATGRKTRLDIQNYGCNGNLLCYHGVVERTRISSFIIILILIFLILMVAGQGLLNFLNSTQLRPDHNLRQGGVLAQHVGRYSCRQEVAGLTPDRGAAA